MEKPKNEHILSCMENPSFNVTKLPCGWLIVNLRSAKSCSFLSLASEYSMYLEREVILYDAELIDDEGKRLAGLTGKAFYESHELEGYTEPDNIFLGKRHMAWNAKGVCIHWGPAPFREIDEEYEAWIKEQIRKKKERETHNQTSSTK